MSGPEVWIDKKGNLRTDARNSWPKWPSWFKRRQDPNPPKCMCPNSHSCAELERVPIQVEISAQEGQLLGRWALGISLRACLKSSNEDGNEGKRENLSRNIKFAFTIFPKSAEFVEPAEKTLYHPAAWQNDKLV